VRPAGTSGDAAATPSGGGGGTVWTGDLADQAKRKYLTYALSVITARALPDVRDGLKPVQRRILYTLFADLHLTHTERHRKSAKVVGDVIGKYHPHGDSAVYEAMVRMAQDFVMRAPLVDGYGNFGSLDGDAAAAYRYTECRLTELASELLVELRKDTVPFRANYDGTSQEPIVVPARFPNLLVNGSTGIAVGMATNVPPHNLGEVVRACIASIDDPNTSVRKLLKHIRGPDFPTGGELVAERNELCKLYEDGRGSFKLRGQWKLGENKRGESTIVITAIPYGVDKSALVEEIGQIIVNKKLPPLIGVQDLSTRDVCIELTLSAKATAEPELVMAYLLKHTRMQVSVKVDFTCLVPTNNVEVGAPKRLNLAEVLRQFLDFRFATVKRRFQYELRVLEQRIHILEGFEKIYGDLDRAIKIIRNSDGKADAAEKLIKAFALDESQADAVLETKLYRLSKLEIEAIRNELADKRKQAKHIVGILKSHDKLWGVVREELEHVAHEFGNTRRTRISDEDLTEEFTAESFIVEEDAYVLLTRDGWVKRQRSINLASTRMREGDEALAVVGGSTKECVMFFSNLGTAYVARINDVPQSTGHGEPMQKLFKLRDRERVIAAAGTDARVMREFAYAKPELGAEYEEPYPHMLAVTKRGMSLRFTLWPHKDPSTSRGRMFAKLRDKDEVVATFKVYADDDVCAATRKGKLLCCTAQDVNLLAGPGIGVTFIKLDDDDEVVAAFPAKLPVVLVKDSGTQQKLSADDRSPTGRAGKGRALFQRGSIKAVLFPPPDAPELEGADERSQAGGKKPGSNSTKKN